MAKKVKDKSKNKELPAKAKQEITVAEISKEELAERSKTAAELYANPSINASSLITAIKKKGNIGSIFNQVSDEKGLQVEHILEKVVDANDKVLAGDMEELESILINQARALDAVFYQYMGKTLSAEYIQQMQSFSQIALKAQNQCRNTLATLAEIKNPTKPTFIKNQNNAAIQQINNVEKVEVKNSENSGNFQSSANELLLSEIKDEKWVDTRTQSAAITVNPEMETVDKSRCKN